MKRKLAVMCVMLLIVATSMSCARQAPAPTPADGPIVPQQEPSPELAKSRTGEKQVKVVWQHSLASETQYFEHVLVNHPQGILLCYWDRKGKTSVLSILDPTTGSVLHEGALNKVDPYSRSMRAVLHAEAEETLLETDAGAFTLPQLPEAEGWLDFLPREDGLVLLGYDQEGRFVTYLDKQGAALWNFRPPTRGPDDFFVLEAFGSRELLLDLGNGLLAVYGLSVRGLIVLDFNTGQVVWDYHIPMEDRICAVAIGDNGIWVGGLSYDYDGIVALLGPDGAILREVEHGAPVTAIGGLGNNACWFMAGWGPDGRNKVWLLEHDRLACEVLEDIEFGAVPQVDNSLIFLDGTQGLLYRWQPDKPAQAYELPFYGSPNDTQVLGTRNDMIIVQHKNEIYAVSFGD